VRMALGDRDSPLTANALLQVNVKELMRWRKLTQAELSAKLGVSQPWLSKRLTGVTPFQIEDVDSIANAFGLTASQLLCAGQGQWDRRRGDDRRRGEDRRRERPIIPREA
jgi:transcriptional regulator with XRE-family HTH domain